MGANQPGSSSIVLAGADKRRSALQDSEPEHQGASARPGAGFGATFDPH